jgi:molecular chaperone GrpE
MDKAGDRPEDQPRRKRGEPGSEDQFARGGSASSASEIGADVVDEFVGDVEPGAGRMPDDPSSPDGAAPDATTELRTQLDEQRDKYLRLAAEFDNYRKRMLRERNEAGARAQADLVKQMLEVIDDIGRFSQFDPATTDSLALAEGIDLVERKLQKTLSSAGLATVNPVNEPFDPSLHEAIATEPALSPEDDNLVSQVYQLGYVFNGQLLRPARVVVKQYNG